MATAQECIRHGWNLDYISSEVLSTLFLYKIDIRWTFRTCLPLVALSPLLSFSRIPSTFFQTPPGTTYAPIILHSHSLTLTADFYAVAQHITKGVSPTFVPTDQKSPKPSREPHWHQHWPLPHHCTVYQKKGLLCKNLSAMTHSALITVSNPVITKVTLAQILCTKAGLWE